jgi:hypothetical protein
MRRRRELLEAFEADAGVHAAARDRRLYLSEITHLSLTIFPNKGRSGVATLTALRLFAWTGASRACRNEGREQARWRWNIHRPVLTARQRSSLAAGGAWRLLPIGRH